MGVCTKTGRISLCHKNQPAIISQVTHAFGEVGINISDMTNKSKGDYAYTLIDLDSAANDAIVSKINAIDGVIKVRVIK
jgi:D-3-phosphoglycerate dehydrogenase